MSCAVHTELGLVKDSDDKVRKTHCLYRDVSFFQVFLDIKDWHMPSKCCLCIMDHGHNKVNNNKSCKIVIVKIKNEMKIISLI